MRRGRGAGRPAAAAAQNPVNGENPAKAENGAGADTCSTGILCNGNPVAYH